MALSRTTPFTGLQPDGLRLGSRRVHCVLRRRTMHMDLFMLPLRAGVARYGQHSKRPHE